MMTQDISGFGLKVVLIASNTFPNGVELTNFADDSDPFDLALQTIGSAETGLNGDLITWSEANPIPCSLNVIPGSDADLNLGVIWEANRVGRGKSSARDVIDLIGVYPDGVTVNLTQGKMTQGMAANSVGSSGRFKSKNYVFAFENITKS